MLDELRQDVRVAWRRLWTAPSFAIVAILTLALGIAANTTIFTLLNALILRELAVRDPKELAQLSIVMRSGAEVGLSFPGFQQIARDSHDLFSALVAWTGGVRMANVNGEPVQANVWMVSGNFHAELASRPALGRLLAAADANLESLSGETVAVLGYEFWQRRYGGDPAVIGRTVQVEGVPFTIVGVTPRDFRGVSRTAEPEITVPITARQQIVWNDPSFWTQGNVFWGSVFGR